MIKVIVATNNEGKIKEIRNFFGQVAAKQPVLVMSLNDAGCNNVDLEAFEDGDTFEANAVKKAEAVRDTLGTDSDSLTFVLADDSGLVIDALGGLPGVDSANFMGRNTPYDVRHNWILEQLGDHRSARFVCVMALAAPNGTLTFKATMEGEIAHSPAGDKGFGYDPIFCIPEFNATSAEISLEQKNKISHRGKALQKVVEYINENFGI